MEFLFQVYVSLRPSRLLFRRSNCRSTSWQDRKSTRLNSSHSQISYAVFCLKKKKNKTTISSRQKRQRSTQTKITRHYNFTTPPSLTRGCTLTNSSSTSLTLQPTPGRARAE